MNDEIICTCTGVTKLEIVDAVKNGCNTVEKIAEELNAGSICGACIGDIEEIIDECK